MLKALKIFFKKLFTKKPIEVKLIGEIKPKNPFRIP